MSISIEVSSGGVIEISHADKTWLGQQLGPMIMLCMEIGGEVRFISASKKLFSSSAGNVTFGSQIDIPLSFDNDPSNIPMAERLERQWHRWNSKR